ncbi:MAG: DUF1998 domain-containing protein, partial [Chloroflexi bacterium]|nr:DUF1998 domain-containing protein [Chloroflexota bacterium]
PEHALINPDNLLILMSHLKCAAFELPFTNAERFGVATTQEMLRYLEEEGVLHHTGGRWHWMNEGFPAEAVSLRSASQENFVIVDVEGPTVIGSLDRYAAPMLLHEEAIYLHEGRQYQVERLDYSEKKAYVRKVDVDYYTDAQLAVDVSVINVAEEEQMASAPHAHGDVSVRYTPTKFKKIKFETRENIGFGPIHLPEESMHTSAYWVSLLPEATEGLAPQQLAGALLGLGNLMASVAPLYVMCDPRDLQMLCQVRSEHTGLPTVYIYESYPGGVGFSAKLCDLHRQLLERCSEIVAACPCDEGCPSCVGAPLELGKDGKQLTTGLLGKLLQ